MTQFRVLCIDDSKLPDQLPPSRRVVAGQIYTVIEVAHMQLQSVLGYRLAEIDSFFPYEFFKASRFLPLQDQAVEEEVKELEETI